MKCVRREFIGGCVCAFGAGVLLTGILPFGVLVFVQGVVIVAAGALAFCR